MLHPAALFLLLLAVPLAILFLWRGRARRTPVPSLAIWLEAMGPEARSRGWTRLKQWLLLACNLGILGLLAFGAAAPGQSRAAAAAEHWAIVLDVSPSMMAREGAGTRLDRAREEARRLIARLPAGTWVTVATAAGPPVVRGPAEARAPEVARWIDEARWRPGRGPRREEVVARLQPHPEARAFHIVCLSDGAGEGGAADGADWLFARIGEPAPNAGIVSAALSRDWGDAEAGLFLEVRGDPGERTLVLELNGTELRREKVSVPAPPAVAGLSLGVPTYAAGVLEARLEPADALDLDDRAWLALGPLARPWVLAVAAEGEASYAGAALEALGDHLDRERSGRIAPRDFRLDLLPARGPGVVVFDGVDPPAALPPGNYLFWGSGGPHLPCSASPPSDSPQVLRWAADHSLLRGASLELLRVARARRLAPGPGDRSLLDAADGSLAIAGSSAGRDFVAFGFRPADSNLPLLVAYPVLFKNAMSWFAGRRAWRFRPYYVCGEPVRGEIADVGPGPVRLRGAGPFAEGEVAAEVSAGELVLPDALRPGWYAAQAGEPLGVFGVNLFDPGEVDVMPAPVPFRIPDPGPVAAEEGPLWLTLALWALLLVGVEWLLFHAWGK